MLLLFKTFPIHHLPIIHLPDVNSPDIESALTDKVEMSQFCEDIMRDVTVVLRGEALNQ
jgi:hypothetical protein